MITKETIEGLRAAYQQYVNGPPKGSTSRDRLETWIEAVLEEYDAEVESAKIRIPFHPVGRLKR